MKYKILNTGNADQHMPTQHGERRSGVTGMAGRIGQKLIVPGMARGEDKNFIVVDEMDLRKIFGLFEVKSPGVLDAEKPCPILMKNVKRNKPLLDNGRLVVLDETGAHALGKGTQEYQSKVVDATMQENQNLKDQSARFIEVLVADGFTEEQAKQIMEGKMKVGDAKLKKVAPPRVATGDGVPAAGDGGGVVSGSSDKNPEELLAANGIIKVGDKEYKSVDGAVKKITAMAAEAGSELQHTAEGMPFYVAGDETVTLS